MASFLSSFTSSPALSAIHTSAPVPALEIRITPSASAYYAGEPFKATISFRNAGPSSHLTGHARTPSSAAENGPRQSLALNRGKSPPGSPRQDVARAQVSAPLLDEHTRQAGRSADGHAADGQPFRRHRQIGRHVPDTPRHDGDMGTYGTEPLMEAGRANAEAGPSRSHINGGGDEDGAQEWLHDDAVGAGGPVDLDRAKRIGHERRSQSLAVGAGVSPQEMVRALGGGPPPPRLPNRRQPTTGIPRSHPHSRQLSIAQNPILSPTLSDTSASSPSSDPRRSPLPRDGPSRPPLSRMTSASSTSSSTTDSPLPVAPQVSAAHPQRPTATPAAYVYGGARSPLPPSHPQTRAARQVQSTCTILWAYTRLVATFHPSNAYIPPDPLLPLRSMMLHQPIGSGSLLPSSSSSGSKGMSSSNSRWQVSFGTGTLPGQSAPSLTGSLVGLASSLLSSGSGGSLEQERKKVWNMKDLPVLETARSLIGVEMKLEEGQEREFAYEMQVPLGMPPSHKGKAWAFEYKMVVSVGVLLGKEERVEEVVLPVRVWSGVSLNDPPPLYNVLEPLIQQRDEAKVTESPVADQSSSPSVPPESSASAPHRPSTNGTSSPSSQSLKLYAKQLLDSALTDPQARHLPSSPGRAMSPSAATTRHQRERTGMVPWSKSELLSDSGSIMSARRRARRGSIIAGDEELADPSRAEGGSAEAVELLSRHSAKSSFDIAKSGELVAVLTLIKTSFRLGESILGVVDINHALSNRHAHGAGRRVLKMSAYLESHETIPSALLPLSPRGGLSPQPRLVKVHADFHAGYTAFGTRMSFQLDVPADATPGYTFRAVSAPGKPASSSAGRTQNGHGRASQRSGDGYADEEDSPGGLTYSLRLAFLVASLPSEDDASLPPGHRHGTGAMSVVPSAKDGDNGFFTASDGLTPVVPVLRRTVADDGDKSKMELVGYDEMHTETVQCEIPIRVLPGVVGEGEGVGVVL